LKYILHKENAISVNVKLQIAQVFNRRTCFAH